MLRGENETVKLFARLVVVCMELWRKRREKKIVEWDKAQNARELKMGVRRVEENERFGNCGIVEADLRK